MKKLLFLIICAVSVLSSCDKDIEIETASYMWLSGDSIPKRNFIMSVSTFYPMDTISTKHKLECQVTLGDSTDRDLLGSKLELNMIFNGAANGTYNVGSTCEGEMLYTTCRPSAEESKKDFHTVTYTLTSGKVDVLNLDDKEVLMTVELVGESEIPDKMVIKKELQITDAGDSIYVDKEVWTTTKRNVTLTGDLRARY